MIPFNTKCFVPRVSRVSTKSIFPAWKLMSECYIEFGLMANSVELTGERVNVGHFH